MKILIVLENPTFVKLMEKKFQKHLLFCDVEDVNSFEELKKVDLDKFDLVICDDVLKDSEGEHIKYLLDKNKKVIVVTSYESEVAFKDRVIDYVFKEEYRMLDYLIKLVNRLYRNRNLSVLLVDDSQMFLKIGRRFLENLNLKVYEAYNGHEALEILNHTNIDIVVTDLEMPVMDGEELVSKIREKYSMNELPILILSGKVKNKLVRSLKLGANDFIDKNFSKEEFLIRIHNIIEVYENLREVEEKLIIDPLTKVYNRSYLNNKMHALFKLYESKTIAMLDIDHFKNINDTYGHQVGDEILKDFAQTIKSVIRKSDAVVRYGGEEFLVFMPNTSKHEALAVMYKIRKSLRECCGVNYTFSCGIADEGETLAEMIKIADDRLYKAKNRGRDLIVIK